MASTRNNNTPSEYLLQQKSYNKASNYMSYGHSTYGQAYKNAMPSLGITPSHMPRSIFSRNSVDIESALFGINSTNLVTPQAPVTPDLTKLPTINYFDRLPLIMPENLVIQTNQRPYPLE